MASFKAPPTVSTDECIMLGSRACPFFKACSLPNAFASGKPLRHISIRASSNGSQLPPNHIAKVSSLAALEQLKNAAINRYTKERSSILVLGLSVHNAPVEMREKLAIPEAEWPRAISELCELPHIEEAGVLSTCNRMEIYVVALSWHRGVREVT
eukprot:c16665_g2_i1 orf=246-710(+)